MPRARPSQQSYESHSTDLCLSICHDTFAEVCQSCHSGHPCLGARRDQGILADDHRPGRGGWSSRVCTRSARVSRGRGRHRRRWAVEARPRHALLPPCDEVHQVAKGGENMKEPKQWESGRVGEWERERGREGERERGREWERGRVGEWEGAYASTETLDSFAPSSPRSDAPPSPAGFSPHLFTPPILRPPRCERRSTAPL